MGHWARQDKLNDKFGKNVSLSSADYWPTRKEIIDNWGVEITGNYANDQWVDIDNISAISESPEHTLYITNQSAYTIMYFIDADSPVSPNFSNSHQYLSITLNISSVGPQPWGTWNESGTIGVSANYVNDSVQPPQVSKVTMGKMMYIYASRDSMPPQQLSIITLDDADIHVHI